MIGHFSWWCSSVACGHVHDMDGCCSADCRTLVEAEIVQGWIKGRNINYIHAGCKSAAGNIRNRRCECWGQQHITINSADEHEAFTTRQHTSDENSMGTNLLQGVRLERNIQRAFTDVDPTQHVHITELLQEITITVSGVRKNLDTAIANTCHLTATAYNVSPNRWKLLKSSTDTSKWKVSTISKGLIGDSSLRRSSNSQKKLPQCTTPNLKYHNKFHNITKFQCDVVNRHGTVPNILSRANS